MAANCDPSTLANAARCFNCVIPVGDQLAVQSYALAKLVGYATDSDGANQLANDARCFSCTIPPGDLLQVQTYLISLISQTTIAAADLPNAARCFMSCVPLGEQNALKSYLLDQVASLGGITISTDPAVLVNDARCISCVVPIGDQTAVQTWLLALLANVDTTDPSGIANAARCYASCIPIGDQIPVQNYLLCQTQALVTPPCITPGSAFQVGVGTRGTTDTNTQLGVRWLQQNNTGSLITSYTVKWGTTAGGPYTFNSGPLPINPKFYVATGLTAGTTYYFIVVANSFSGCSSANSAEANGTTTGGVVSNGLLNSLISYWKFDVNVSPYADSFGGNPLTGSGTSAGVVAGIINGGLDVSGGGSQASHVSNADFMPVAGVDLSLAAWISSSDWTVGGTGTFPSFLQKGDNSTLNSYGFGQVRASNRIYAYLADSSTFQQTLLLTPGAPTPNVYHQIVMTWDATAKLLSVYFDGAFVTSALLTTNQIVTGAQAFIAGPGIGFASWLNLRIDEMALWHKPLNATDVTNIFNGGACLPFSSYQA